MPGPGEAALPRARSRHTDFDRSASLLRGLGHENRREHDSPFDAGRREVFRVHAARAHWRGGADHSVEFPDDYGDLETWSGAGDRLHRGSEARRTNSADRADARRTDPR